MEKKFIFNHSLIIKLSVSTKLKMIKDNAVYIVSAARTPTGSFQGSLANLSAIDLGAHAVNAALNKVPQIPNSEVQEIYFGSVIQANLGQSPAKQVALKAGLQNDIVATTINKVCASGLKSIIVGAQSILTGHADIVVAGGCESMSNVPYYATNLRKSDKNPKFGSVSLVDGLQRDGLSDAYEGYAMGLAGEKASKDYNISRQEQDEFAIRSYERAVKAQSEGKFKNEIASISIPGTKRRKEVIVDSDEEFKRFDESFLKKAKPVFVKDGTVTAANASPMNDGGSAVILVSGRKVKQLHLKPIAKVVNWGEAEQEPINFTTCPAKAIPVALKHSGLDINDIDYFEINEAFSVVGAVNAKLLKISKEKLNVYGGAVALGHALGSSGCRIVVTLLSVLSQEGGRFGAVGICNGGGGASALVIEKLPAEAKL